MNLDYYHTQAPELKKILERDLSRLMMLPAESLFLSVVNAVRVFEKQHTVVATAFFKYYQNLISFNGRVCARVLFSSTV